MGADGVLVSFPVFKTERPARVVGGEFDSHTLPPSLIQQGKVAFFSPDCLCHK